MKCRNILKEDSSYIYIDMHGNQGIAAALNAGINIFILKIWIWL